jgi:hypothetical protein
MALIQRPYADPNERVLRGYAASRALALVGDDSDVARLTSVIEADNLAPNVQYWLERTREALEKQWNETTGKWPEPWLPWEGKIENVTGTIISNDETIPAKFTLWLRRGFGEEYTAWGGSVDFEKVSAGLKLMFAGGRKVTLRIQGRRDAEALVSGAGTSGTILLGSGEYPA